ncbi:hypothetical protein [Streptomyces sp. TLI_105]|uniref:hypothetical protein n=1 Tax=Streptomyces sp. TLI_105 TaxID=1881019 RepID=UPI00089607CD|nr:hypothetical protein [Streptomyces sp. TLI_105]SEE61249.1 hypothetical protein SAMN05428939_8140 [Streptomyces sp. TLI_105]
MTARQNPLYIRYMAAVDEWTTHVTDCSCRVEAPYEVGAPLFERFSRLQDAWTNHLTQQRR